MKKLLLVALSVITVLSMVACGGKKPSASGQGTAIADATSLLTTVWASYGEDEKFPAMGGDASNPDSIKMDEPGKFTVEGALLDSTLGFPAASANKIEDAASLMHMMNANSFTCGVYKVTNSADIAALTDELKTNVLARQWLCGFPDKLVIATVDNYVVAFFGETELIDTFKTKLTAAYPSASVVADVPVM